MLVSDGDKKPHLINCEATCVYEEATKRISNIHLTSIEHSVEVKEMLVSDGDRKSQ